tara:strand:- start:46 stop:804 length:759 start_codon:yes stop_codon:yes gene_type:complete
MWYEADPYAGWTPLMFSIKNVDKNGKNSMDKMNMLIKHGANVNAWHHDGAPLHLATQYGSEYTKEIICTLINAGANINIKNVVGQNALITAIIWFHNKHTIDAIHVLIENGVDINAQSITYKTALMFAVEFWGTRIHTKEIIYTLVNAGADINIKNNNGKTALDIACDMAKKSGNFDMIDILQIYKDNRSFKWTAKNNIQLKLWSAQNIKIATTIILCWRNSYLSTIPWDLIREYILPMTIDRKDTVKLMNK